MTQAFGIGDVVQFRAGRRRQRLYVVAKVIGSRIRACSDLGGEIVVDADLLEVVPPLEKRERDVSLQPDDPSGAVCDLCRPQTGRRNVPTCWHRASVG